MGDGIGAGRTALVGQGEGELGDDGSAEGVADQDDGRQCGPVHGSLRERDDGKEIG